MTDEKESENMDAWMDNVVVNAALPEGKGTVSAIHPPINKETRFGTRKVSSVVINGKDGSTINVQLYLPAQFPMVHPKSNLAKILKTYGCVGLKELIGKEVAVASVAEGIWVIKC